MKLWRMDLSGEPMWSTADYCIAHHRTIEEKGMDFVFGQAVEGAKKLMYVSLTDLPKNWEEHTTPAGLFVHRFGSWLSRRSVKGWYTETGSGMHPDIGHNEDGGALFDFRRRDVQREYARLVAEMVAEMVHVNTGKLDGLFLDYVLTAPGGQHEPVWREALSSHLGHLGGYIGGLQWPGEQEPVWMIGNGPMCDDLWFALDGQWFELGRPHELWPSRLTPFKYKVIQRRNFSGATAIAHIFDADVGTHDHYMLEGEIPPDEIPDMGFTSLPGTVVRDEHGNIDATFALKSVLVKPDLVSVWTRENWFQEFQGPPTTYYEVEP